MLNIEGKMNFWQEIDKPIFALAPMEDVTDTSFREIVLRLSEPELIHVLFSEFTSTDGLCHEIGRENVSQRLVVSESEKILLNKMNVKLVAQIWGREPENYRKAVRLIDEMQIFDGIDINMGCPVKKIVKQGTCSALIKEPELSKEIMLASMESTYLPISVKTRTGINSHITESWVASLLETKPAALTLHGRTQKMMSKSAADWNEIAKAVKIRDEISPDTIILGNGDVFDMETAYSHIGEYGVDGVMIGRGIFKGPWFFSNKEVPTAIDKINILKNHVELFDKTWGGIKNISILKKFFKIYAADFNGAAELRNKLMNTSSKDEIYSIADEFLNITQDK